MKASDHHEERDRSSPDVHNLRTTPNASSVAHAQAVEDLQQSEARFQMLVHSIKDYAIFILDPKGNVQSWNEGAQRLKGYSEDEIIGKHFSTFYTPEDAASGVPQQLLRTAAQEGRVEREGWRVRKDGTRFWADVVITALRDNDGRVVGFGKVTRDLTERKRAEEERIHLVQERIARQAAEESVRVRDEFLGVAAHELKTPVTSLLLQIQLLARRLTKTGTLDPVAVNRALSLVAEQSQKLSVLMNQLLDVARVANGHLAIEPTDVNVVPLVASVFERLSMLSPDRQFDFAAPEAVFASVDPLRLEQVLTNLVENAHKYSPTGPIEVTVSKPNSAQVQIAVRDYGPGVPESQREHLFDRFFQADTRNHRSGMGLGLYISTQIARLHGGSLTAEFPEEGGSRFVLTLPIRQSG